MDRKLIRNYIYNVLYQMVKVIMPLVLTPYVYKHITAPVVGISDYAGSIMQWFILIGILGVNIYGNREIARVRDNKDTLSETFFEIFWMQMLNMIIMAAAYYGFITFAIKENYTIFVLAGTTMLASMLDITWFFYGVEDFKKASIRNITVKIIGVTMIMLLCKTPEDLWKYVLINSGSELIGQFIMFFQLRQYIEFKPVSLINAYKHHFIATFRLFVPTIAISVYTMLDRTMLGALHSAEHLNYYKTAMGFIQMFLYFITSIGTVVLSRVSNVIRNQADGEEQTEALINTTMKFSCLLAFPMCFGMIAISRSFVHWFLPTAPIIADLIMYGSPIIVFISMSNVTGIQYMVPVGLEKQYTRSVLAGAFLNFILNTFLIPRYGAYGAILASVAAEFTVFAVQYSVVIRHTRLSFLDRSYLIYLLGSIIMFVIVHYAASFLPASFPGTLTAIVLGMIVYGMILLVTKEDLTGRILSRFIRR
ncbi:MAG: polysaccharide biosynthesis C-terminal domain-containing protein [Solobacterium sp.]|nr:polysaccharide biosynthesis C-terminal domain-containing protein [Solobacterium sp.]